MGYTIPVKVYELLEEKLGKDIASALTLVIEESIRSALEDSKDRLKITISEELKQELATKYDIELVKKEIDVVRKEIELVKLEFKKDLRIATIILLAAIIILNQNSIEFIARLIGILK